MTEFDLYTPIIHIIAPIFYGITAWTDAIISYLCTKQQQTNMADDKKIIFSMVGVSKIYPPQKQVLKNIYLSFFYGAKIGIIGLNGSGKSTLMKVIAGLEKEFQGEVVFSPGYTVGYLEQDPKLDETKTVKEIVM